MPLQPDFPQRIQEIDRLLGEIESKADPSLRATVKELVKLVMDLHGAGIERMLEMIHASGDVGENIVQKLGRDELVASLLILYGIHPLDVEARVMQALDKARSRLRAHDAEVELLSFQNGEVRLRLRANGHGCGSNPQALKEMIEEAMYRSAPDISHLVIEGGETQSFVPLEMLQGAI